MKEIIYLDTKLVNSLLAQSNSGLITKLVSENAESSSDSTGENDQFSVSGKIGISIANMSGTASVSETKNNMFTVASKDLVETALDDYSIELLLESLGGSVKQSNFSIGDIVVVNNKLNSYNFESIKRAFDFESIKSELDGYEEFESDMKSFKKMDNNKKGSDKYKQLEQRINNSTWINLYYARLMSNYLHTIFLDSTLIKIANTISICDNSMLRMNTSVMDFINIIPREATVFGIVESRFNEAMPKDFTSFSQTDQLYTTAPGILTHIALGSNRIITKGDFFLRPIAIYFEL